MEDQLQNFRFMFDNISCGVFFQNASGEFTDVNPAALTMFGLSRDQFLGRTSRHPEWRVINEEGTPLLPEQHPSMAALRSGEPVTDFVAGVFNPLHQDYTWLRINAIPMFRSGKTVPHSVFVTLSDISEQRRSGNSLLASEQRYRAIVNSQTEFVNSFLPGGIMTFVNDAFCRYSGLFREELLGKSFFQFVHKDDLQQLIRELESLTREYPSIETVCRVALPDGTICWHQWTTTAIFDKYGVVSEYQSVGRDITAQKEAELAKEDYAAQLTIALGAANAGSWKYDFMTGALEWSPETYRLYGIDPADPTPLGEAVRNRIHSDDREQVLGVVEAAIRNRTPFTHDFRIVDPDGTIRWVSSSGKTTYDSAGRPLQLSGITLDITARKAQEDLLQKSERLAAAILNASTEPIMLVDSDGIILMANSAMLQRLGKNGGDLIGTNAFSHLPDDVSTFRRSKLAEVISSRRPVRFEDIREGRCIDSHVYPIIDADGTVSAAAIFALDITENKSNLDQLSYINECFSQALNGTQHHILYRLNVKTGCYDYLSPAFEKITGHPVAEFKQTTLEQLKEYFHPDDRIRFFATIDEAIQTRTTEMVSLELEYRLRKADGDYCWLHDSTTLIFDENSEMQHLFGSAYDITGRKRTELMLQASEERFRSLMELSPDIISIITKDGVLAYNSPAAFAIHGYTNEEMAGRNTFELIHPDDQSLVSVTMQALLDDSVHSVTVQYRYRNKDGTYNWMEAMASNQVNNVHIGGLIVISRDISTRKQLEIALRESEERYRQFVATANEGIGIIDSDFKITYANSRLAAILGYEVEELVGTPVKSLLIPEEQGHFAEMVTERLQGKSGQSEYHHIRKDGSSSWLLASSTPIFAEDGTFQGCFSMLTDITKRKHAEEALQHAHALLESRVEERTAALAAANEQIKQISFQLIQAEEQERSRIAAELHDQVGQSLLLAKIKLDMFVAEGTSMAQSRDIQAVSMMIEYAIQDIRTLTFSMRPPLLDTAGLEAALEWLCPQLQKDYGLQVAFRRHDKFISLPAAQLYPIYQAVRELLLNVTKHAGVDRADLSLEAEKDNLVIRVADSGTGFSYDANPANFGSTSGFGLFNVQRRISQLGGQCLIATSADGTVVTLTIPLQQK